MLKYTSPNLRARWTQQPLSTVMEAVRNGNSVKHAALISGVPWVTLIRYLGPSTTMKKSLVAIDSTRMKSDFEAKEEKRKALLTGGHSRKSKQGREGREVIEEEEAETTEAKGVRHRILR